MSTGKQLMKGNLRGEEQLPLTRGISLLMSLESVSGGHAVTYQLK
jgi:hypothetical protein